MIKIDNKIKTVGDDSLLTYNVTGTEDKVYALKLDLVHPFS